jgi:UDP-N-acetylmuramate dehydrogenase
MLHIEHDIPLAPFTTIGIGGPAKVYARVHDLAELREALDYARREQLAIFILGGGSNLLISDAGFAGIVIHLDLRGITVEDVGELATVRVAAGEPWDSFVSFAVVNGWAGIECLSGIPGSTGATPIQNVGAYGQDVSETVIAVEALDRSTGTLETLTNEQCRFGYRASLFKNLEPGRYIVTAVTYRLRAGGAAEIRYAELAQELEREGVDLHDLVAVREAVIRIRKRKGMVVDPEDPDSRSDGSFFMNPVLSLGEFEAFSLKARDRVGPDAKIPSFPSGEAVKLSAAWLIERAGFHKGLVHGNVGLSTKHTLAVINRGEGTAQEVVELVEMIRGGVRDAFGVDLHPEPNFIGFS